MVQAMDGNHLPIFLSKKKTNKSENFTVQSKPAPKRYHTDTAKS